MGSWIKVSNSDCSLIEEQTLHKHMYNRSVQMDLSVM